MSPRPMKPPRIASSLLSTRVMARARRSARLEETVRAEEAARLAEMAQREEEAAPTPALTPALSHGERVLASTPTPDPSPVRKSIDGGGEMSAPAPPSAERTRRKASAETRAKMSQAHRGHGTSAETRAKISQALRGQVLSAETRAKISRTLKGRKLPAETRAKVSQALRGRPVSAETRAKISRAQRGHMVSAENRAKMSRALRGEANPHYWHGAYCMPAQPVKSVADVIADLSAKQARISALLDHHLDSGPELTPQVLTLFTLGLQIAGKLGQLLRYQESQADSSGDEVAKAIQQALDEIAKETGWEV